MNTETPRAVSAIVRRGEHYLLVLRANPPARNMYAFPGGRVDPNEDAKTAAMRELAEETGIIATEARAYATYDLTADRQADEPHYHLTVFEVTEPGTVEPVAMDDAAALGWFRISETGKLSMPASMHACFAKLAAGRV
ncbi:NUDIX domain-containing protein [Pseudohoeflea suaedae]|uniref:NUDIX domain-containing protein n=1 Tax=Pseudohoeflea suaedae TaxID=877384 RepID=A0A4R5PKS9_9HYPH|nr:NUDIX domain-containing protein [Pseudohoeflea suaedae]